MNGRPIIDSSLKRAVQAERFKSQAKVSAAAAATLAVIAQEIVDRQRCE